MNLNTGGWASRVLTPLLRVVRGATNATVPVIAISEPVNSETAALVNADVALVARGTGATLAQVPDGTTRGGDKRGAGATDWQKVRDSVSQVASSINGTIAGGSYNTAAGIASFASTVGGGERNIASSSYATVAGGTSNSALTTYSFVGGGQSNTAQTSTHAAVCGGSTNTASGQYSFVGGGLSNTASNRADVALGESATASGGNSTVSGGYLNTASAAGATVVGGTYNSANASYSTVIGNKGTARGIQGNIVFAAHDNVIFTGLQGGAQSGLLIVARQTTDATATVLTSNTIAAGTNNQVILPANAAYYFRGSVIAGVTGAGDTKAWTFEGAIKRGATAASTAIVGSVVLNTIAADAGASAWTVAITADTTNGGIAVTVTGAAATTIRWVAKIETTEMTY